MRAFGLSRSEARAYHELLVAGQLTAGELAARLGVPTDRAVAIAVGLHRRRLVSQLPGDGLGWRAVAPRAALTVLLQRRRAELVHAEDLIDELDRCWRTHQPAETDAGSLVEVLINRDSMTRRLAELRSSSEEMLGLDRPPYFETDEDWVLVLDALRRRPVTSRTIYSQSALTWPGYLESIREELAIPGAAARCLPKLPVKVLIYDRRTAVLPLTSDDESDIVTSFVVLHGCRPSICRSCNCSRPGSPIGTSPTSCGSVSGAFPGGSAGSCGRCG